MKIPYGKGERPERDGVVVPAEKPISYNKIMSQQYSHPSSLYQQTRFVVLYILVDKSFVYTTVQLVSSYHEPLNVMKNFEHKIMEPQMENEILSKRKKVDSVWHTKKACPIKSRYATRYYEPNTNQSTANIYARKGFSFSFLFFCCVCLLVRGFAKEVLSSICSQIFSIQMTGFFEIVEH